MIKFKKGDKVKHYRLSGTIFTYLNPNPYDDTCSIVWTDYGYKLTYLTVELYLVTPKVKKAHLPDWL